MTAFCNCPSPTLPATRALTWEDHDGSCGWPDAPCADGTHGQVVHEDCGRVVEIAFCTCARADTGFAHDPDRDWWVHPVCGWPTRAWYEAAGKPAPSALRGVKPRVY